MAYRSAKIFQHNGTVQNSECSFLFVSESNRGGKKQRDLSSYQNSLRPNWPGWAQFGGKNDDILHNTYSALKIYLRLFLERRITCHFHEIFC